VTVQLSCDVRDTASAGLRALMLRVGSIDDVLLEIGDSIRTSTQKRFEDEQSPEGEPWKEHSAATAAKRGAGAQILRDELNLYDLPEPKVSGSKVAVGTNLIYARIHQLGGRAGRNLAVTIPARPYLGLSVADVAEIGAIVIDHVEGIGK
jgi:phage virion morphogenesis protein